MKKRIITLALALVMLFALSSNAMAAKKYTIDISSASDKTWEAAKVALTFVVNGDKSYVYSSAELGSPVLFNTGYSSTGAITLVPIRAVCNALNVPITWNNPANGNPGYAELTTSTHGKVKLYMGATSITAADGTVYEEKTYAFPDGTPIPLCLERNGRIYVPVRFLSSFVLDNPAFDWSQNRQMLTITSGKAGAWSGWSGVGVNTNIDTSRANESTLPQRFPNLAKAVEKYGETMDISMKAADCVDTHLGPAIRADYEGITGVSGFECAATRSGQNRRHAVCV